MVLLPRSSEESFAESMPNISNDYRLHTPHPCAMPPPCCHAGTPADELEHLEGVMSRVCNFHVADSKPMQVPGPDQVRGAVVACIGASKAAGPARTLALHVYVFALVRPAVFRSQSQLLYCLAM